MPDPSPDRRKRIVRKVLVALLVVVPLWAAGIYYFFFYAGGTRAIVTAYAAAAKGGGESKPLLPDADSDEARALFAASGDWRMRNWTLDSPDATGCIWTDVTSREGKSTPVAFFLNERDGQWKIARVSARKSCVCSDADDKCTMAP